MATRAKQQYYGDGNNIVKNKRTFELSQDILDKIEEAGGGTIETIKVNGITQPVVDKTVNIPVPLVEDNLNSYSTTNALSANQGRLLQDAINNFQTIGHFLSLWNAETGLPVDEPSTSPYTYNTGDYYIVSKVASRNFRPDGTEYISGQASSVEETADLAVNDFYFFNGTHWFHLSNEGKSLAIDDALSTSSTNAVENRVVTNALNGKANVEDLENFYTKTEVDDKIDDAVQDNVKDGVLTIQKNGADQGTFSANQATDTTINLTVNKIDVGLSNVDNTSDADKPISTATQTALDGLSDRIDALETGDIQDIKDDVADLQENKLDKTELGDATLTVQKNGTDVGTFTANSKTDTTINLELTKADVGLGNVDNTADIDKPISTATQTALDSKADKDEVTTVLADKADKATTYTKTEVDDLLDEKQDVLTAGDGISITNKVISNTGVLTVNGETGDVTVDEPIVYTAGNGIDITDNEISADTTVLATKADLDSKQDTLVSGVNIKTINNESLLGAGDITISAPTYTAGENITIDQNNEISAVDTIYTAGEGIEIKNGKDYSAMRGPCPEGFHVPTRGETTGLYNVLMIAFGISPTDFISYMHAPLTGVRNYTGSLVDSGTQSHRRTCTKVGDGAATLMIKAAVIGNGQNLSLSQGFSIRPFKDEPIMPDNSWTIEYQPAGATGTDVGIYHNSGLGLISISSDGDSWITIADKNLGATTVYNSGDALTDANCGNLYQWGNNYGFPYSGGVTTSSTLVDASSYGPGNYYNSSTFISASPMRRDSSGNANLRGGVTGVVEYNNAITNTGVTSVNGQTGDVIISGGDVMYDDFKFVEMTGDTFENLSGYKTINANTNLLSGTNLKEGMQYVLFVTNSDSIAHVVTVDGVNQTEIPAGEQKMLVYLATASDSLQLQTCEGGGGGGQTPGNGTITLTQGGVEKGTFTVNQSTDTVIDLDAVSENAMEYPDFNFVDKTGTAITLDLNSTVTAESNFTVNVPADIKDGQIYVLRVDSGATEFTMTLGDGITNPYNVDTSLGTNTLSQFVFLAVDGKLELQPQLMTRVDVENILREYNLIP